MRNYTNQLTNLANVLAKSQEVNSFSSIEEKGPYVLAYTLLDIYESSIELTKMVESLQNRALSEETIDNILNDIGEELRHIIYHINESRFYQYINTQKEK